MSICHVKLTISSVRDANVRLCEPVVDRGCDTTLTKFRALCFRPINVMNYIVHDHKAEVGRMLELKVDSCSCRR